jgi:hypothetical protein
MNTPPSSKQAFWLVKALLILHKQTKFWAGFDQRSSPWAFFVVNNGDEPNSNVVQQMRCSFCYLHEIPQSHFDKKTIYERKGFVHIAKVLGLAPCDMWRQSIKSSLKHILLTLPVMKGCHIHKLPVQRRFDLKKTSKSGPKSNFIIFWQSHSLQETWRASKSFFTRSNPSYSQVIFPLKHLWKPLDVMFCITTRSKSCFPFLKKWWVKKSFQWWWKSVWRNMWHHSLMPHKLQ